MYSWIDKNLINCLHWSRSEVLSVPANICDGIFWKSSNVSLNTLTILANSSIWDAWLGPEFASAGGHNTAFKIQAEISLWQQVKIE